MNAKQEELMKAIGGEWIDSTQMAELNPDINWRKTTYFLIIDDFLVNFNQTVIPCKFIWINFEGIMGSRINGRADYLDNVIDAKILIKGNKISNFK